MREKRKNVINSGYYAQSETRKGSARTSLRPKSYMKSTYLQSEQSWYLGGEKIIIILTMLTNQ